MLWSNAADSGTLTASSSLSTLPVTNLQNQQLALPWRSLSGLTEVWLLCDLGSSQSVDLVALLGVNLDADADARVRVSTADVTGAAGDAYDSTLADADIDPRYPHLVRVLGTPVTGRYVRIDMANTSAFQFEAGRLLIGKLFRPTYNFTRGFQYGFRDRSRVDESEGGQQWVERRVPKRTLTMRFPVISDTERREHVMPMQMQRGASEDIGVLLDLGTTRPGEDFLWGLQADVRPIRNAFLDRHEIEIEVVERA